MKLPFFYNPAVSPGDSHVEMDETSSKHLIQVLRMSPGDHVQLTDGKGQLYTAEITDDNRKKAVAKIVAAQQVSRPPAIITIAISLLKNNSRFEWFLEKATEIGVNKFVPLVCDRTEKQHFRMERMQGILVSAMLQSQQCWLPELQEPVKFNSYINTTVPQQQFIAHCEEEENKTQLASIPIDKQSDRLVLIGPEGDFTPSEITAARAKNYIPIALGNTRLRTETAGIAAAVWLCTV